MNVSSGRTNNPAQSNKTAGTKNGKDAVLKTNAFHNDPFYILYEAIMDEHDKANAGTAKEVVIKAIKPLFKTAYTQYMQPVMLKLEGLAEHKESIQGFRQTATQAEASWELSRVIGVKSAGKTQMASGFGEKMLPYIDDIFYVLEQLLDGETPSQSVSAKPVSIDYGLRNSLNIQSI